MASSSSLRYSAAFWVFLHAFLLASLSVRCSDDEDHLLQGINSYRQSASLPALSKHDKANCLAGEIADELEDQPCPRPGGAPSNPPQLANFQKHLDKCDIDANTTKDGTVLPVCVPKRVPTLVLTNYTQTQNAKYLNDSKYTGAGIGMEDDWTVLVLTTNTQTGMFTTPAAAAICLVNVRNALFLVLLSIFLLLLQN